MNAYHSIFTDDVQELAHYALATTDIEYNFPFGWDELWGIANRGSYDLDCHSAASGVKLKYTDPITKQVRMHACACFAL